MISNIKESTFEDFIIEGSLLAFSIDSINFVSCAFKNNTCISNHMTGVIYFKDRSISMKKSMFSLCRANWGIILLYVSSVKNPYLFDFNQTLVYGTKSDPEVGGLIGTKKEFHCYENNFTHCSSDDRASSIAFDVCTEMSARFLNFENSNSTASLVEIYHDDYNNRQNYLLTIEDSNFVNNRNQRSIFFVIFRNDLKLSLHKCHFLHNSQCSFYSAGNAAPVSLQVIITETNFDIPQESISSGQFNAGTSGITFGNSNTYLLAKRVYGPYCKKANSMKIVLKGRCSTLISCPLMLSVKGKLLW